MKIADIVSLVKQSEIIALRYEGKVLGFRAKYYNVDTNEFDYYDFDIESIKHEGIRNFIRGISKMDSFELHVDGNGLLVTDFEIENNIIVKEFKDEQEIARILSPFIRIYKSKGVA